MEYDRRLWEKALANGQTAASRRRVTFVLADAVEYEVPPQGNRFFFFNPFALHTLKRVLGKFSTPITRRRGRCACFSIILMKKQKLS